MRCSQICRLCFALTLAGCAAPVNPSLQDGYREALLATRGLVDRYGERRSPQEQAYFAYLRERLTRSLPASANNREYHIILLDTDRVLAFAPGGGRILLSKGLVQSFGSEAELAFAVAHELAHEQLGHVAQSSADGDVQDYQRELELAADRYAIGLMAAAGYDPRMALYALNGAYSRSRMTTRASDYPELDERMAAVQREIERTRWLPPGTVDRRAFQLIKRELARE